VASYRCRLDGTTALTRGPITSNTALEARVCVRYSAPNLRRNVMPANAVLLSTAKSRAQNKRRSLGLLGGLPTELQHNRQCFLRVLV
jgi:hypothetical protein